MTTPGPCGCRVRKFLDVHRRHQIDYCPTHAAAFDLLEVAEAVVGMHDDGELVLKLARAAIAEAKGEEPGKHHDYGPGPEWERGPNMKDVG